MKPVNVPNLIPVGTVLNATVNSSPQQVYNVFPYSVQILVVGTPTGSFKLQASCDPAYSGKPSVPVIWTDIPNSSVAVTTAGSVFLRDALETGYNWVRVVYTDTSSGVSTATVTSSTFNGKGF